jgi:hypothetical protein
VTTRLGRPTTAISLARVSGTIAFGAPFVLSATVTPTQASGILTFSDAVLGVLGSAPVRSGVAMLDLTMSAAGTHLTYAGYALSAGDSSHAACISEGTQIAIAPARTATTLSLAQSTVAAGLPVEFNVQVTTLAESIPTGMVEIRMGNRVLASALVHALPGAGFITLAVPSESLGTGDFAAFAAYRGDTNDDGSSCAASAFNVLGTPTATMLSLSAGQVALSTEVRVQVNVLAVGQSATPVGSVSFLEDGSVFTVANVDGAGVASAVLRSAGLRAHAIAATYQPSGLFAASESAAAPLRVTLPLTLALAPETINAQAGSTANAA